MGPAPAQREAVGASLRRAAFGEAAAAARQARQAAPADAQTQLWASHVLQQAADPAGMVEAAQAAADLQPGELPLQMRAVECRIYAGDVGQARALLRELRQRFAARPDALMRLAELHIHLEDHADAALCYEAVLRDAPQQRDALNGLASTLVARGRIDEAEAAYEQLLRRDPLDGDAWVNRASLRSWRAGTHHVGPLQQALRALPSGHPAQVPLLYALAKELEDLGDDAASFDALAAGAALRRAGMAYDVRGDVQTMQQIAEAFDDDWLRRLPAPSAQPAGALFVTGLPRTGTTLVERILDSHSEVGSIGESNAFVFALMGMTGSCGDKAALIRRSAGLDMAELGRRYRHALASHGLAAPRVVNKTPANWLYRALIHAALPEARVLHLQRHPMDACYAMFKTLFRMGYPYSYSLADLGAYYAAYDRLLAHWRTLLPQAVLDVSYEGLVQDQEGGSRRLLAHAELEFEPACLAFHANPASSSTASAAQVRRPIYKDSVGKWRRYEAQLAPLQEALLAAGVDLGGPAPARPG